jgi:hypothetical protein
MIHRKSILTVAGILLVVGLALCFVTFRAGAQRDFQTVGSQGTEIVYDKQNYQTAAQGIEKVVVAARDMPVTVLPSDGDEITIDYFTAEKDPYEITLENGVLALRCKNKNSIFSTSPADWFFGGVNSVYNVISQVNLQIQVHVPKAYAGDFQLDTSNAAISLSDLPKVGEVRVDTSNGAVKLTNIGAELVETSTSNGAMTLEEVTTPGNVSAITSNGSITAKRVGAGETLKLDTSNGRISVDAVLAQTLEISTSNGAITGNVDGKRSDYTISSSTSNADNNIDSGGSGPRRLNVNTSNGAISISFLGD